MDNIKQWIIDHKYWVVAAVILVCVMAYFGVEEPPR